MAYGVQYVLSSVVAYILFCRHRWHFLIKRTSCIFWCGLLFVSPDVAFNILHLLMWRICCSSDIQRIFCHDAYPIFPEITHCLHFLMCSTIHYISWCGVLFIFLDVAYNILYRLMRRKIVLQTYVTFPDVVYILRFLTWRTPCIPWCGIQ